MRKPKKCGRDSWEAILEYHNTTIEEMESTPAQRMMSRRTKGFLPTTENLLKRHIEDDMANIQRNKRKHKIYD